MGTPIELENKSYYLRFVTLGLHLKSSKPFVDGEISALGNSADENFIFLAKHTVLALGRLLIK